MTKTEAVATINTMYYSAVKPEFEDLQKEIINLKKQIKVLKTENSKLKSIANDAKLDVNYNELMRLRKRDEKLSTLLSQKSATIEMLRRIIKELRGE